MGFKRFLKSAGSIAKDFGGELGALSNSLGASTGYGVFNALGTGFNALAQREERKLIQAQIEAESAAARNMVDQDTASRAPSNIAPVPIRPPAAGGGFPPWALPVAIGAGGLVLVLALRR